MLKEIPGFKTLKAFHHGRQWYIVDCTTGAGDPYKNTIGGHFGTYQAACIFAMAQYTYSYS